MIRDIPLICLLYTSDKVLEVLGAVDTEVFSKLLRKVIRGDVTGSIHILEELIVGGRELSQFVGDFTWYMRNLLLVKTSENPEEAIDVSSDNMKLLKAESTMLDAASYTHLKRNVLLCCLSFSESFVRKRSKKRQPLKLHRKIRRENRNNKSKRQTKTGRILKAIRVIKITEVMLQAEIKRGE